MHLAQVDGSTRIRTDPVTGDHRVRGTTAAQVHSVACVAADHVPMPET